LDPKVRHGEGRTNWIMNIPWRSIEPYAPPLDSLLGVNIVYREVTPAGVRRSASLIADPHADSVQVPWRRYVPLSILPSDQTQPLLAGRLANTIVSDEPVALTLVVWSATSGEGTLSIVFKDNDGNSLASGPPSATVAVQTGSNRWQQIADLAALPTGPYQVQVNLDFTGGDQLTWQANLLRLREEWYADLTQRQTAVRSDERLSLAIRLDAVRQALARHHRWDDPSPIATTLGEIGLMTQRAEQAGTILEPAAVTLVAVPGARDQALATMLYLPPYHHGSEIGNILLIFADRMGDEVRLTQQIAVSLADTTAPVLLTPLVPGETKHRSDNVLVAAQAALTWAQGRFGATRACLVGIGRAAADALHFSLRYPTSCQAVLMLVDDRFVPWPGRDTTNLEKLLLAQHHDIPLTFTRTPNAADDIGQAGQLITALQKAGFKVSEDLAVGRPRADSVEAMIAAWYTLASSQPE
jgi:hypothetical protein